MEVASAAPEAAVNHRYLWFLIESLAHARLAWQEADDAAESQHPAVQLADLKLAVEDFQCAASLVQTFQSGRGPDEHTTKAIQVSARGNGSIHNVRHWLPAVGDGPGTRRGLSIARFVNPGDRVFVHETEAIGKAHLSAAMTSVAQALMRPMLWPAPLEGTIGPLWHVITPGFDRSQNLLVAVQQMNVRPTSPPGSADEMLLQALFSKLRAMWDSKGQS